MYVFQIKFKILSCHYENGKLVHVFYSDVICWSNQHVVHGIIAIFSIVLFYFFSVCLTLIYFEYKIHRKIIDRAFLSMRQVRNYQVDPMRYSLPIKL